MSIQIPRRLGALVVAIGSLGLVGGASAAAPPAPLNTTPAITANPKVFTWPAVPPAVVGSTVTYEYCPLAAAASVTPTATAGLTATLAAPQGASTFFIRSVESALPLPVRSAYAALAVATDTAPPVAPNPRATPVLVDRERLLLTLAEI